MWRRLLLRPCEPDELTSHLQQHRSASSSAATDGFSRLSIDSALAAFTATAAAFTPTAMPFGMDPASVWRRGNSRQDCRRAQARH
jgi:hypothetical protein